MYANAKAKQAALTCSALETVARELFETRGFHDVSAEEIALQAGVTRGALYHHYAGKEGLFEEVVDAAMRRLHGNILRAAKGATGPMDALRLGVRRFLEVSTAPRLQRILFIDAPSVLGWQRWREMDERYGLGMLKVAIEQAIAQGSMREQPSEYAAHILMSSLIEVAMMIARSEDQPAARRHAEELMLRLIDGLA